MSPKLQVTIETASVFDAVVKRAGEERRSLSGMAAILIERGLTVPDPQSAELAAVIAELGESDALAALQREARKRKKAA